MSQSSIKWQICSEGIQCFLFTLSHFIRHICYVIYYAAFTLSSFDNQERNLTFVKTAFQVLKLKFLAFSRKQTFYLLHKHIVRAWQQESIFLEAFLSVPGCQTCMYKRGISIWIIINLKQHLAHNAAVCCMHCIWIWKSKYLGSHISVTEFLS